METIVTFKETEKKAIYEELLPQLRSLLEGEGDLIANLANTSSVIKSAFPEVISWVGFYLLQGKELVLGPFQGKPACVRIQMGKGVCGHSAETRKPIIVPDVTAFPGHIVCDPESRSEIVLPLMDGESLIGVLDVDSPILSSFDEVDQKYLAVVAGELTKTLKKS